MIAEFFANNWATILLSLVTAGLLGAFKSMGKKMKEYQNLLNEKDEKEIKKIVETQLNPLETEIEELRGDLEELREETHERTRLGVAAFRIALIQLCKQYIANGYITALQFERLTELHNVYLTLSEDDRVEEWFDKAKSLPTQIS
jgi:Tfp pilus assembly ATPase PilU